MNPVAAVYGYLKRNRIVKPVAVLAGLLVGTFVVWLSAPPELKRHIVQREVLHLGFGYTLVALFGRVLMALEGARNVRFGFIAWNFLPVAFLLSINATNEWLFAMTPPPLLNDGTLAVKCGWGIGCGDWQRNLGTPEQWKSIADMCVWAFAALLCPWRDYKMAPRLMAAREDYLAAKARKQKHG